LPQPLRQERPINIMTDDSVDMCWLFVDAVTEVQFTLMPITIMDADAARPMMPFCQFKRHLSGSCDTLSNDTVNCVNVQLHSQVPVVYYRFIVVFAYLVIQ